VGVFCALLPFFLCFLRFLLFSISSSSPDDDDCVDDDDDDDDDDDYDDDNRALVAFSFFFLLAMARVAAATVGTLQDGYVRNVPLPRVPREQRASPEPTAPIGIPLHGYFKPSKWIPTLPCVGNALGFSQRHL
jgi:hypothetical protein